MKSTVVDESLSSFKPMYCSREYQASTRLIQQYEKSTLNWLSLFDALDAHGTYGYIIHYIGQIIDEIKLSTHLNYTPH